jgi:hypothetical protein
LSFVVCRFGSLSFSRPLLAPFPLKRTLLQHLNCSNYRVTNPNCEFVIKSHAELIKPNVTVTLCEHTFFFSGGSLRHNPDGFVTNAFFLIPCKANNKKYEMDPERYTGDKMLEIFKRQLRPFMDAESADA